jgi:hypothetical protein
MKTQFKSLTLAGPGRRVAKQRPPVDGGVLVSAALHGAELPPGTGIQGIMSPDGPPLAPDSIG